jgi:hypothetical protein
LTLPRPVPTETRPSRRSGVRWLFLSVYILYLLGIIVAADYALHWRRIHKLRNRERPPSDQIDTLPSVPLATMRRLGRVVTDKRSSFVNFPVVKPPGALRIGVFGDSHTYGQEVDETSDYPAQLAGLLEREGVERVEVLNFGNTWFGFHQSYMLWDEVGRRYGLDIVLIGPTAFWSDRETRFNHSYDWSPYYLHARFIAEGDSVRLIDVIGKTHGERFRAYYSFLTPWRYLRFDRGDPPFLAAALFPDRTLGNPFYYDRRPEAVEALQIDTALVRRMIAAGRPIALGFYDRPYLREVANAIRGLASETFCAAPLTQQSHFPYLAPGWHDSPAGNALTARQYAAVLLGHPVGASIIHTGEPFGERPSTGPIGLQGISEMRVVMAGLEVGSFFDLAKRQVVDPGALLDRGRTRSLLIVKRPGSPPTEGVILPLSVALPGQPRLVERRWTRTRSAALPPYRLLPGASAIAVVDLPGLDFAFRTRTLVQADAIEPLFGSPVSGRIELDLGDQPVLQGTRAGDHFELRPLAGRSYWLRGVGTRQAADLPSEGSGSIELELRHEETRTRVPLATWRAEPVQFDPARACPTWVPPLKPR